MAKVKRVRQCDLAGLKATSEVCLLSIDPDGTLYLTHVEADVTWPAEDGGYSDQQFGRITFNGEIRLPIGQFKWTWVADDHALMLQRGTAPTGPAPATREEGGDGRMTTESGEWTASEYDEYVTELLVRICDAAGIDPNDIDSEDADAMLIELLTSKITRLHAIEREARAVTLIAAPTPEQLAALRAYLICASCGTDINDGGDGAICAGCLRDLIAAERRAEGG